MAYSSNSMVEFEDVEVRGTVSLHIDELLDACANVDGMAEKLLAVLDSSDVVSYVEDEVMPEDFASSVSDKYLTAIVGTMDDTTLSTCIEDTCGADVDLGHFVTQFSQAFRKRLYESLKEECGDPLLHVGVVGLSFSPFNEHQMCTVTNGDGRTVGYIHLVGPNGTYHASYAPPQGEVMFFSSQSLDTVHTILVNVHHAFESMGKML